MKVNILGGSYKHKYADFNSQRCINWYSTTAAQIENNKVPHAKFPTPGLEVFCTISGNRVRGIFTARDLTTTRCFAVVDDTLYEIFKDKTSTSRGVLPNAIGSSLPVYMAVNTNNELLIIDGSSLTYTDGYAIITNNSVVIGNIFNLDTNTLAAVSDIDFPNTPADQGRVYFSHPNDFDAWTGADVFTPTFRADPTKAVVALREDVICFGTETVEAYINDGQTPFSRLPRTTQHCGLLAPHSTAVFNDGIIFLGGSGRGEPRVYLYDKNYVVQPISPPSVNSFLSTADTLEDCSAFFEETKDGHIDYNLHVPGLNTTLVFDVTTSEWHERQSKRPYPDSDGEVFYGQFRGRCFTNFDGLHLFGDRYTGNILLQNDHVFSECGETIKRQIISPVYEEEDKLVGINWLEIDYNSGAGALSGQGSSPLLMVTASQNGGNSYQQQYFVELGKRGVYNTRAKLTNLGIGRAWLVDITCTDPIDIMLKGAVVHGSVSTF